MDGEKVIVIEVAAPSSLETSMDRKERKKAGFALPSVVATFKWARFPLPGKKKKKLVSVQMVLGWAFLAAISVAIVLDISAAMDLAKVHVHYSPATSKFFQEPNLTPAQEVSVDVSWNAYLWSCVPEGVAAMVGLLLPRCHAVGRWSLASMAIVSATVAHYFNAWTVFTFVAGAPGAIGYNIIVGGAAIVYLLLDLLGLISLLVEGPEDE